MSPEPFKMSEDVPARTRFIADQMVAQAFQRVDEAVVGLREFNQVDPVPLIEAIGRSLDYDEDYNRSMLCLLLVSALYRLAYPPTRGTHVLPSEEEAPNDRQPKPSAWPIDPPPPTPGRDS